MQIEYCSKCNVRLDGKDLEEARRYLTPELLCEDCRNAATTKPNRIVIPVGAHRSSSPRRSNTHYAGRAARAPRRQTSPGSLTLLVALLLAGAIGLVVLTIVRSPPSERLYEKPQPGPSREDREAEATKAYRKVIAFENISAGDRKRRIQALDSFLRKYGDTTSGLQARAYLRQLMAAGWEAIYRVNCGGNAREPFMADAFCTEGDTTFVKTKIARDKVAQPAPETVYRSQRHGNFVYSFPGLKRNGEYIIRLHFCELDFDRAGKRIFDVRCNGSDLFKELDIWAVAGAKNTAMLREATVKADAQGYVRIEFRGRKNEAKCNGIEILNLPPPSASASTKKVSPTERKTEQPAGLKTQQPLEQPAQVVSAPQPRAASPKTSQPQDAGPRVVSLTLIDAKTDKVIPDHDPLVEGVVLSYDKLGTNEINLRANVEGDVQCVVFDVDKKKKYKTEDHPPYAMAGNQNEDYSTWKTKFGPHSVTATPYSRQKAKGEAGKAFTLNFTLEP